MAVKKRNLGKVIASVNGLTIRQVPEFGGRGQERKVVGQTINITKGKNKVVETGFRNRETAVSRAKLLTSK